MAPDGRPRDSRYDGNGRSHANGGDTSAAETALKAKLSRKRTKTGCLTCRKRRIKCGEERPVCKNCIKSKRHCEGYNQRVVFKSSTFDYQPAPHGGAHITFQVPPPPGHNFVQQDAHQPYMDPSIYGQLRPRPDDQQFMPVFGAQSQPFLIPNGPHQHPGPHGVPTTLNEQPQLFQFAPALPTLPVQGYQFPPPQTPHIGNVSSGLPHGTSAMPISTGTPLSQPLAIDTRQHEQANAQGSALHTPSVTMPSEYLAQAYGQSVPYASQHFTTEPTPVSSHMPYPDLNWPDFKPMVAMSDGSAAPTPVSSRSSHTLSFSQTPILTSQAQAWTPSMYVPRPELARPIDYQHNVQSVSSAWLNNVERGITTLQKVKQPTPEYYEHEAHVSTSNNLASFLAQAAVETQDDDYFDVESDEEMDLGESEVCQPGHSTEQTLSKILIMTQTAREELRARRYDTFLRPGILDKYRVDEVASPLRNPATARVFAHFIAVTGPSLSIFERHPRNTSLVFAEGSIPLSQQGLWTYRMPMAALRNQGLLHAMLALASLHIARLQNACVTPSMQHYAWALKRIHAAVGKPHSRLRVTTIAASMLLGFYEVMTADHAKWNLHLAGSRQLFVETDFVQMTRDFRLLKRSRSERFQIGKKRQCSAQDLDTQDDLLDQSPEINEQVTSNLLGRVADDERCGTSDSSQGNKFCRLDLSKFEILKDLYWWYCKQDVYQSIVSGNPLLMDFSRWADCPPRALLGKSDAVYGSFDHLVLLLGRIADFAARDRQRKLEQMESNGRQSRPRAGMDIPEPPPTPISATRPTPYHTLHTTPTQPTMNSAPPFFGMAPPPKINVHMPVSYAPIHDTVTPQSAVPPDPFAHDIHKQTEAAILEYGRIRAALLEFANSLGEAFEPLGPEYQVPMETAFGPTRFYRSYDIGCLWAVYNMAMIIAIRSHPNMPPAAHHAAAMVAHETSSYAQEIGRIAAGIVPGPANQPLNPTLGAALCESCMPSFFAAIQYHDPQQRHETVERIWSIAKRTGWGSVEVIANGCETAWVKAAAAGRGPPYRRRKRQTDSEDPRLNGSWEKLNPAGLPDESNDGDRRLVKTKSNARLTWAWGVLGVEEDVRKMKLNT